MQGGRKIRKIISIWICMMLCFSILTTIIVFDAPIALVGHSKGATLYVNTTGSGGAYTSIQDAINSASYGDTVFVYEGTYYENIDVNKAINLTAENKNVIISSKKEDGDAVFIESDWVNITGFTITGGSNGVTLSHSSNITIRDNIISNADGGGIFCGVAPNSIISNNRISNNKRGGIKLFYSPNNRLIGNVFSNNGLGFGGIRLEYSEECNIMDNQISSHTYDGIHIDFSPNTNIINNNISKNHHDGIEIGDDSTNCTIIGNNVYSNNRSGIYVYSSNNEVRNNNVYLNNRSGIFFGSYSNYNNVTGNNIYFNNDNGGLIFSWRAENNHIADNNIWDNFDGIHILDYCDNNTIANNLILSNNGYGINITLSSNNTIYSNLMINNTIQAQDDRNNNYWNRSYPNSGNYWSDYYGDDNHNGPNQNVLGGDGIGDIEYLIDEDSIDYYPLIESGFDMPSPKIHLVYPSNDTIIPVETILKFHIEDDSIPFVTYSINGGENHSLFYPYEISTDGWTDGEYIINADVLGFLGQYNSTSFAFEFDSTPPEITDFLTS